MTCVIFKSIVDCDVYFGLWRELGGVFNGDLLIVPLLLLLLLNGDVGISGDDDADDCSDAADDGELLEFVLPLLLN
jgi:hypothetical protein